MVGEVLEGLGVGPGAVVLDATLGFGGHAHAILERSSPSGRLIGIDRDPDALEAARARLAGFGDRVMLIHGHFGRLSELLQRQGVRSIDGALFDLGVSSFQLDTPRRGFSFAREGPLDMRMDPTEQATAADLVNHVSPEELTRLLRELGEERWAGRIARAIVRGRPFQTTAALAETIRAAVPPSARHGRIDAATRTFQAIRIAVNRELELLPEGLKQAVAMLNPDARIAVLAYHSLEDRIVKNFFKSEAQSRALEILTKKPLGPSEEETARNPRSRSAKLRVARRRRAGE